MGSTLDLEAALTAHLVAIPFPGRGHINPMLNFCKLLATKQPHFLITLIVTEEWLAFLSSETNKPLDNMQFRTIPNVIPSELVRAADHPGFIKATSTEMKAPVEVVIQGLQPKPVVVLYDPFLTWGLSIQGNIPTAAFWPMSATVFSMFLHHHLLCQNRHLPLLNLSEQGETQIDYIPGVPSTRILDLPTPFYGKGQEVLYKCLEAVSCAEKSNHLLFSSISGLEAQVINSLKSQLSLPIYAIGPALPYIQIKHKFGNNQVVPDYIKWLDNQAENSILYISQGSFLSLSDDQVKEIVAGIHDAGVHYLWVTRIEASKINGGNSDRGMVVPWCDQLRVLSHPSMGGFWTHCGWNSTKEGVFAGVPMITSPLAWDQVPNSKMIVDDWGAGWRVKKETGVETLMKRDEITILVKRFMDLESIEGKELRKRVKQLKENSQQATAEGGSADHAIYAFIRGITKS